MNKLSLIDPKNVSFMETLNSCNTASLNPYNPTAGNPWNLEQVRHITRRLGYGLDILQETSALNQVPTTFVDNWITQSKNYMNTPAPPWAFKARSAYTDFNSERFKDINAWVKQTYRDTADLKLKGKLTLFWHNHFVTKLDDYDAPSWMYQYYNLLQTHAFGNFKDFVKAIGKNEAMLTFLNGRQNRKNNPNENYARELFELFTLGVNNNYTQTDITEAARALTGYNGFTDVGAPITFTPNNFDNTPKTIFGVTANFDHDSLIDHLFAVRKNEIAIHIVTKIYRRFVCTELPNSSIIETLANTFKNSNWEILPVLKQLFKSEHFFDSTVKGVIISDPIDCLITFFKEGNFPYTDEQLLITYYFASQLGQEYYSPIDVAGWQGNQSWINSTTLTGRWKGLEYIMWTSWNVDQELFRQIALNASSSLNDPLKITTDIINRFIARPLYTTADYALATSTFKGQVPQNYYDDGSWNLSWESVPYQVVLLLQHIFRMPEFQLK